MLEAFTMAVRFKAKTEHAAGFGARLIGMVDPTRLDAGCIVFDVHQVHGDPCGWYLYEGWRSKQDSDAHMAKPDVQAFFADWEWLLAEPPDTLVLELRSERHLSVID